MYRIEWIDSCGKRHNDILSFNALIQKWDDATINIVSLEVI